MKLKPLGIRDIRAILIINTAGSVKYILNGKKYKKEEDGSTSFS